MNLKVKSYENKQRVKAFLIATYRYIFFIYNNIAKNVFFPDSDFNIVNSYFNLTKIIFIKY